jgi:hypothetical protein
MSGLQRGQRSDAVRVGQEEGGDLHLEEKGRNTSIASIPCFPQPLVLSWVCGEPHSRGASAC